MRKVFTTILVIIGLCSYGQQGIYIPFKLIVIKPDTAVIDKSLYSDIDSVQTDYLNRYYASISQMEQFINDNSSPGDSAATDAKEQTKIDLAKAKAIEPEVKKFKYFHFISAYSLAVYQFYFNEYKPYSAIIEMPGQGTGNEYLKKMVGSVKADYVVFFDNIHTEAKNGKPVLKLTTSLYSEKDNKIIFTKQTEGDSISRGEMWGCGEIRLNCLLINGVRTSTDAIIPEIAKRQIRNKSNSTKIKPL